MPIFKGPFIRLWLGGPIMRMRRRSLTKLKQKLIFWGQLGSAEADLEEARAKIVVLNEEKEKWIDALMFTPEFVELMVEHDAQRRTDVCKEGMDAVVEAIMETYREIFVAESFSCPLDLPQAEAVNEGSEESIHGDDQAFVTAKRPADARG